MQVEEEEDVLDVFESSLLSTFDYVMPAEGEPGGIWTWQPPHARERRGESAASSGDVTVRVPGYHTISDGLFAHAVWHASILMADLLHKREIDVASRTVLELGCGAALPGLVAARDGAARIVVLSDYATSLDAPILKTIEENVRRALDGHQQSARGEGGEVVARGHIWGTDPSTLLKHALDGFDDVLLADCVWAPQGQDALVATLCAVAKDKVHVTSGFHTGRLSVRNFLRKAQAAGFLLESAHEVRAPSFEEQQAWVDDDSAPDEVEDRGRWVLHATLRAPTGLIDTQAVP